MIDGSAPMAKARQRFPFVGLFAFETINFRLYNEVLGKHGIVKLPAHRAGLPGNVDMITGSAFLPASKAGHPADLPVKYGKDGFGENRVARPSVIPSTRHSIVHEGASIS
ncbi:MAG: hypothetical protein A2170_03655 [Deltaproteobacteria bacterium RBG_13_53_10]|nr:MAG: hypothetical protein A2170_03655 [Deltaproteobacteria bacterium RBG_13_53_10]